MLKFSVGLFFYFSIAVTACSSPPSPSTPETIPPTTQVRILTPTLHTPIPGNTPLPTPTARPRELTICLGAEPDSLWLYGSNMLVKNTVLESVYDGPIDALDYDFQPVILEKLPSLADGDARINQVTVESGSWVVNDAGAPVQLQPGEVIRPYGCFARHCAVAWEGEDMQMAQLSADFTLLEGITWADGEALTAADSVFSYQIATMCDDGWGYCGQNGLTRPVGSPDSSQRTASYQALNSLTTRWVGLPGYLDQNYNTNFFIPLPEHQLEDIPLQDLFEADVSARHPLGWGAYVIEEWVSGDKIRLRKNPNYFRADEGLPRFDQLEFRFVGEDDGKNLESIRSGECDFLDQEASPYLEMIETSDFITYEAEQQIDLHYSPGTVWEHLDFSLAHADYDNGYQKGSDRPDFFGDQDTRHAIAMCIDWERMGSKLPALQLVERLASYVPNGHPLFNPETPRYEYDPESAQNLLEEVGWQDHDQDPSTPRRAYNVINVPDGTEFSISYTTTSSPLRVQVAELISEALASCGIQASVVNLTPSEFFAEPPEGDIFSRRFDLAQFAWLASPNPPCDLFTSDEIPGGTQHFPNSWLGQNNSGYSSPDFDQACWEAMEKLPGQPGFIENHYLAQQIFAEDLPLIPLYLRDILTITRPDFCGHRLSPTVNSDTWNIEEFGYGEDC